MPPKTASTRILLLKAPWLTLFALFLVSTSCVTVVSAFTIGPLLSTCIDSCQRGCEEIRRVHQDLLQQQQTEDNDDGSSGDQKVIIEFELKDASDPRSALTVADQAAQDVIIGSLRATWGDSLHVVGEEEDDNADGSSSSNDAYAPLLQNMVENDIEADATPELDPASVTIYVDPVDGTREFCEGRLENVQVLVGIAIDGQPVAGAIGLPFPAGGSNTSEPFTVVYGLDGLGSGTIGRPLTRGPWPLDHNIDGVKYPRPHFAAGDSPIPVMEAAIQACTRRFGGAKVTYGGAGNKILGAGLEEVAASMSHKVGGPWDLCAPIAICRAMGGTVTNIFGGDETMLDMRLPNMSEFGYIASPVGSDHDTIVATVNQAPEVKAYREKVGYDAALAKAAS